MSSPNCAPVFFPMEDFCSSFCPHWVIFVPIAGDKEVLSPNSGVESVSANRWVKFSCGAAVEGSPRREPWVVVKIVQAPAGAEEMLPASVAPAGACRIGTFLRC